MADPVHLSVWAPNATSVDAVLTASDPAERRPLHRREAGNWAIDLPPDTDYLLSVDGGEPRPDPRSARQPFGVHGPSRTFDPAVFSWTDQGWAGRDVLGEVLYEVHIGTFTDNGTLDSAIKRLDHLVELGVGGVELMPVVPFPGERGWGYDGVSLYAVHEAYGGPEALQRFVDAAHARGLAVCLDVVYNHFGPAGNYAPAFGPYFTEKHHTPWGAAINLDDEHCEGVRAFIVDNAVRWLRDFHVDALRLDAVHALVDDSPRHILAELSDAVASLERETGRPATLIAESDLNQVSMITPTDQGGRGMDGQWADDVHHALHSWLTGETFGYYVDFGSPEVLAHAFERVFVHDGGYSTFRSESWGAPVPDHVDRRRFVSFTQNHDQVGNRGLGDRPDERLHPGTVAGGAALLLLSPFTPMLFQGQEWGTRRPFQFFTDHESELGAAVSQGRLLEFAQHGWDAIYGPGVSIPDPQDKATFEASTLDWSELAQPGHADMLAWHRTLIRLRRHYLTDDAERAMHAERAENAERAMHAERAENAAHAVRAEHGEGWFSLTHGPLRVLAAPHQEASIQATGELVAWFGGVTMGGGNVNLQAHSVAIVVN
ncbi:MAG: malto-oligosyltrehalose trehalohydrolase [Actinomycetes bacterium]